MLEINDNTRQSLKKSYVQELIHFIEDKKYILEMLCRIKLVVGMIKEQSGGRVGKEKEKEILEQQLDNYEIEEDLSKEEKEKFKNIYRQLDSHDYGELLEYLVQTKGPYKLDRQEVKYSLRSRVYHDDIKSNHNFDVIFYYSKSRKNKKTGHIIIEEETEFHECKNNILNWLPDNKERISETKNFIKAAGKLEFCKNVHTIFKNGKIYMPTFTYTVGAKQACLNDLGYEFIQILGIRELLTLFEDRNIY